MELINRTKTIVLAKALRFDYVSQQSYRYYFETIEVLKGRLKKNSFNLEFKHPFNNIDGKFLKNFSTDKYPFSNDFNAHKNSLFWDLRLPDGRIERNIFSDCKINPFFILQKKYLLFIEKPFHHKSFEQIETMNDKWLLAVRKAIQNPSIKSGFSQTPFEYLKSKKSIYYLKCFKQDDKNNSQILKHLYGHHLDEFLLHYISGCSTYELEANTIEKSEKEFLLAFYQGTDINYPIYIPVINGLVDFTFISTEIEFKGNTLVPLTKTIYDLKKIDLFIFYWKEIFFLLIFVSAFFFWKKFNG